MLNSININLSIVKLLLLSKLHNFYAKIEKIFSIKLNNSIYFLYKIIKILLTFIILLTLCKLYYNTKYNNFIFIIFTILIVISNFGFIFNSDKKILKPQNIELFQISKLKEESIGHIFLITEYLWTKFKEIDLMIPLFFIMMYLYGSSIMLYTILVESIIFLITIYRINIVKNKKKKRMQKVSIKYLVKYIVVSITTTVVMYKLTEFMLNVCRIFRKYLTSFSDLNQENLLKVQQEALVNIRLFFGKIMSYLEIDFIGRYNNIIMIILIIFILMLIYMILRYKKIDYKIQNHKFENNISILKEKYMMILNRLDKKYTNNFLITKDLNIMNNMVDLLKKDFFQTLILPYDYFVIITLLSAVVKNVNDKFLIIIFTIFCVISIILNQVNTLVSNMRDIFKFEQDEKNIDLYRISKYSVRDLLEAKINLCLFITLFPFTISIFSAIVILVIKFGLSIEFLIATVILLIIGVSIYLFAPKINLYIYPYIMVISKGERDEEKEVDEDKLINKFCEIPKRLLILPMMYLLLFNSVIKIINYNTSLYVLIGYIILTISIIIIEDRVINKILKRGNIK